MGTDSIYVAKRAGSTILQSYHILDTAPEGEFDELTELAAALCDTPIALISFLNGHCQWFKSKKGLNITAIDQAYSFCTYANNTDELLIIKDAQQDERFASNPLVTGYPHIRFYAGAPLLNEEGFILGYLCVIDQQKKELTEQQQKALKTLAHQVVDKLELRKKIWQLQAAEEKIAQQREERINLNHTLQQLNQDLTVTNQEFTATNEQLLKADATMQKLYDQLSTSETLFRNMFEQAPLGFALLTGPNMVIEQVNARMLHIWGRTAQEVLGKPHHQARPELQGQPIYDLLDQVFTTGNTQVNSELRVFLKNGNGLREAYVNSVYSPVKDQNGKTTCLLVIVDDVTERVAERRHRERVEEQFRITIESAEFGTWYLQDQTRELVVTHRMKEIFGYHADETLTLKDLFSTINEEYRTEVIAAIKGTEGYNIEFPVTCKHSGQVRWVKAFGKRYLDVQESTYYLSGVVMDITERKQDDQRKSDFIGIVSHELKTPLTSLNGYLQIMALKAQKGSDASMLDLATKAGRQIERMQALISGFLDVARMSEGKIYLNRKEFDMAALVKLAEEESLATITSHNIIFHPVKYTPVEADEEKIEQVLVNFINNAVKYSPANSNINVVCVTKENVACISVQDEGMGIDPKDQPHIFNRFYRVESDQMKNYKGFGIGLYICKEIIERHGGQIGVDSTPGKGSSFWFTLPTSEKA